VAQVSAVPTSCTSAKASTRLRPNSRPARRGGVHDHREAHVGQQLGGVGQGPVSDLRLVHRRSEAENGRAQGHPFEDRHPYPQGVERLGESRGECRLAAVGEGSWRGEVRWGSGAPARRLPNPSAGAEDEADLLFIVYLRVRRGGTSLAALVMTEEAAP
jgi:hypothetical protein